MYKRLIGQSTEREGCDEAMVISYMTIYEAEDSVSTHHSHTITNTQTLSNNKKNLSASDRPNINTFLRYIVDVFLEGGRLVDGVLEFSIEFR